MSKSEKRTYAFAVLRDLLVSEVQIYDKAEGVKCGYHQVQWTAG